MRKQKTVNKKGNPTIEDFFILAEKTNLSKDKAKMIINKVKAVLNLENIKQH